MTSLHAVIAHRRWRNQPVAGEVDPRRARRLWLFCLGLVLAISPLAFYLFAQNECVRLAYEINALHGERDDLLEQERRLRARRAALQSLDAVQPWAEETLGLAGPLPEQVIVVDEHGRGRARPAAQRAPR